MVASITVTILQKTHYNEQGSRIREETRRKFLLVHVKLYHNTKKVTKIKIFLLNISHPI